MNNDASRKVSKLVCYAQSTSAMIYQGDEKKNGKSS